MTFVQRTKADQSISMNCAVIFVENLQNISVCAKSIGAANAEVCRAGQSREARLLTVPRVAKISPLGLVSFMRLRLAAGSTDRCNTFCELLSWGLIEQGLSGSFVELPCYRAELGLAM
jgi:hypothetical protein